MYRTILASVIAPLIFPFIGWPATNSAFRLLSGTFSWNWDVSNAVLNAPIYLVHAYTQMFLIFLPMALLCRKKNWTAWWVFVGGGIFSGFFAFMIVAAIPDAIKAPALIIDAISKLEKEPSLIRFVFGGGELRHYQLGSTFTSGLVAGLFWLIAVRKNPWFELKKEPVTEQDTIRL